MGRLYGGDWKFQAELEVAGEGSQLYMSTPLGWGRDIGIGMGMVGMLGSVEIERMGTEEG